MNDIELIKKYVPLESQKEALEKLEKGYPVQYIIGNVEFYGNIINVSEKVLIPRFETEYLIEKTLKYFNKFNISKPNILEIGTGSGCISIALKKSLDANILAIDISAEALEVAKLNALNNDVDITFLQKDIHEFETEAKYDLIISNPPYVPFNSNVDQKTKYEPQNAIFAPEDGIHFYKIILERLHNNLNKDYLIAFEIGDKEGNLIKNIVKSFMPEAYVKIEKDYNDFERYIFITNKKEIFE
ncbi:MAG: peptide chain release factor N(5)-glutamine methyltransferase [Bacilli bacterium]|nr:peptide chain release factor N(5)-glutamine methyltransferase [Bacilli bacterium]